MENRRYRIGDRIGQYHGGEIIDWQHTLSDKIDAMVAKDDPEYFIM